MLKRGRAGVAFDPIDKLVSLINASVQQLNEPQQTFNDVQALVSKIHGEAKKIKQKKEAQNAKQTSTNTTSTIDPGGLGTGTLDPGTGTGTGAGTLPVDPISTSQQRLERSQKFVIFIGRLSTKHSNTML